MRLHSALVIPERIPWLCFSLPDPSNLRVSGVQSILGAMELIAGPLKKGIPSHAQIPYEPPVPLPLVSI